MTKLDLFKRYVQTMPFEKWHEVKGQDHLRAIKDLINQSYGWDKFYLVLNEKFDQYRKREV